MDMETLRSKYKTQILEIAARNKIENIRVFGSVARGEAGENSDVDFLVHLPAQSTLFDLGGAYMDLKELLGCKIDLITDESMNLHISKQVFNESVPL